MACATQPLSIRWSRDPVALQGLTEAGRKVHKVCVETKSKPSDFADLSPVSSYARAAHRLALQMARLILWTFVSFCIRLLRP